LGEDDLSLQAANGTKIEYDGWIEVEFQFAGEDGSSEPWTVPILIGSQDNQEHLIIGFNVIEEVIKRNSNSNASDVLPQMVNDSLPSLKGREAKMLVNLIQSLDSEPDTALLRVGKQDIHIAAGGTVKVKCHVYFGPLDEDLPVVFEPKEEGACSGGLEVEGCLNRTKPGSSSHIYVPVFNNTEKEMTLRKRTELGTIQLVQSVTPLPVETEESLEEGEGARNEPVNYEAEPSKPEQGNMQWIPPVDLSRLSCGQLEGC